MVTTRKNSPNHGSKLRRRGIMLLIGLCPSLIGASEPVRLKPSSQWVLDYGADSCRLIRQFGEGKDVAKISFEAVAPSALSLEVFGGTLRPTNAVRWVRAKFLPGTTESFEGRSALTEPEHKAAAFWRSVPNGNVGAAEQKFIIDKAKQVARERPTTDLVKASKDMADRAQFFANIKELSVVQFLGRPMILETGSLGRPMKMFDDCERDLLRQWGVDPAQQDMILKPAWAPEPFRWFRGDDFPRDMLWNGAESDVLVRLAIDATGKVNKCTAISPYAGESFKTTVCHVFKSRSRFAPAELADGTKVASYWTSRISFRL